MSNTTIKQLLAELTLEEKAMLCGGKDFWNLHGIERLNLPSIMVTDGPHGLRKQAGEGDHVGLNAAVKATCFPTASGLAATWNTKLIEEMGVALGKECRAEEVSVLLGPGTNIKRNPLGGRNFEYFSEDPLLAGDMSAAWIKGVQSQGVGTSLKHFAVNNHEHCRMTVDAIVDQRTLREIYLPAFERAVKQTQPWTVMCSYNKVNGTYAAEHKQLLDDILVKEWGFEGIIVTDWGANNDRVEGVKNGQHLEMPSSGDMNTKKIIAAVENGQLSMEALDKSVARVLELILKSQASLESDKVTADLTAHHELAARIAEETCVLLKNDGLLPVSVGKKVAVIGALANNTRYQGAGSSKINPFKLEQPLDEIKKLFGADNVTYTEGYHLNDTGDSSEIVNAVELAKQADVVFLFAGLTPKYESEGFDRQHLNLPQVQLDLINALGDQLAKTVVVLQNGAPVVLPFVEKVPAILEAYLGGQAGASAIAKVLSGDVNPSGKLAETFPASLDDVPSQPYFPGSTKQVQYREAIWVGYRYFDTTGTKALFPFGHGLSYTNFTYYHLTLLSGDKALFNESASIKLQITITNTGNRAGAEVVQCYVGQKSPSQPRPAKELKAFKKVFLEPGESKEIVFELDYRAFAYWHKEKATWVAESGEYQIHIGASVADIRDTASIVLDTDNTAEQPNPALESYFAPAKRDFNDAAFSALLGYDIPVPTPIQPYTMNSTLGDIAHEALGKPLFDSMLSVFTKMMGGDLNDSAAEADKLMAESMVADMPLRNLPVFNSQQYSENQILQLIASLNNQEPRL
ncbi:MULTISPECIES: glycoside hydrolase family 3 C-terminal domain-containing protein [Marinomonas]|uniref:Beta-D-glucoside glucohydrolase n=1 Tax=Marinomonas arctica TaxID=383750 RepID=A0A7H1J716_9GAMM|nr:MULTISPECIES: glycoside hydrolase family 3 C-terminal domain-containing protein [Marinomonas]MCS7485687.1 glycosyl hydrolase family 3 [Marinomonas sp. BSi20414]QNT06282.1 glycoside hydrolase family 3 C-terminal domain-containing protein [Marinomonas arctica]GGN28885.1 glycosyl hydrolase [Marinomonas arctica]